MITLTEGNCLGGFLLENGKQVIQTLVTQGKEREWCVLGTYG